MLRIFLLVVLVIVSFLLRLFWLLFSCLFWGFILCGLASVVYGTYLSVGFIANYFGGALFGWALAILLTLFLNVLTLSISSLYAWLAMGYSEPIVYLVVWPFLLGGIGMIFGVLSEKVIAIADCDNEIANKINQKFI